LSFHSFPARFFNAVFALYLKKAARLKKTPQEKYPADAVAQALYQVLSIRGKQREAAPSPALLLY
jgi:tryptophanase